MDDKLSYKKELAVAMRLAKKANGIILKQYGKVVTSYKSDKSPITDADLAINSLVVETIKKLFPTHGVLGEEQSHNLPAKYTWVCDPIDGTVPFVMQIPVSKFSLALCYEGKPIVCVVGDPFGKKIYSAVIGKGAFCNGERIRITPCKSPKEIVSIIGHSAITYNGVNKFMLQKNTSSVDYYCAVQSALLVVTSMIPYCVMFMKNPWDVAAVVLLVTEAGGVATDFTGKELRCDAEVNGIILANNAQTYQKVRQRFEDLGQKK